MIKKLQFQVLESEKLIEALEDEKNKLKSSQLSTKEQLSAQMNSLEKVYIRERIQFHVLH